LNPEEEIMADADTNTTTGADATTTARAATTTRTTAGGGSTTGAGGAGSTAGSKSAQEGESGSAKDSGPTYRVDGQSVSRDEYLRAAEKSGWNPTFMAERDYYPSIRTKK
jgi:hypothetical protein